MVLLWSEVAKIFVLVRLADFPCKRGGLVLRALIMRTIKCLKSIQWMPWR